ncbi:hypothetical protein DNI29_23120 [Hymenobacter sediminis]|uniref:hypothetical protein n=1 Tax=Hymenobacter sediminis TaxID=2218621 RepID=UPI000DA64627|nr:hypothetical protein [Hymenobacter sediminis]RPD43754.1 hypothetical protein DNI29_23120 [Hymenobacter sediminis]
MATSQKNIYDVWASVLLFVAFALSLLMNFLRHTGYFAPNLGTQEYIILYLCMPVALVIYYFIGKGKREAKTLFLALYAVTLWEIVTSGKDFLGQNNLATFDFLSQQVLHLGACLLVLYTLWLSKSTSKPSPPTTTR